MNKKWHTNKTQPNATKYNEILVIWKNNDITIEMPNVDDWNILYLVQTGDWKHVKNQIKYWQYVDVLFKKELEENNAE